MTELYAARAALVDMAVLIDVQPATRGVPARTIAEVYFSVVLEKMLREQMDEVLKQIGDPPDMSKLGPDFWKQLDAETQKAVQGELEAIYLDSALALLDESPIGVDWGLVNQAAATWARQYTYELVSGVNATTRAALREKVGGFFEQPTSIGDLRRSLEPLFGTARAQMIGVTETTRASVEGQRGMVREVEQAGIQMRAAWLTSNDETVCPICEPLNGLSPGDDGQYHHPYSGRVYKSPPAHVNCRCNERFVIVRPK